MKIRFKVNTAKAVEALVWIIQRGESNVYNAMKIFFAADKYHLNRYAWPVTGDTYVAMRFGTVPSWTYAATRRKGLGFTRTGTTLKLEPGRVCDLDELSESDVEALEHGYKEYAGKSFKAVLLKNHREKAWLKAVERTPGTHSSEILFEDMITSKQWIIDDLLEFPINVVV